MTKTCSKCKTNQLLCNFRKSPRGKYGVRSDCKNCQSHWQKEHRKLNKEKIKVKMKIYRSSAEYRTYARIYKKNRLTENIEAKTAANIRSRIIHALHGENKSAATLALLGCSIDELRAHLERQFTSGMTWANYGVKGWHIDHRKPCAAFDLADPAQQRECFHYTNLQPLWAKDNLSKGDKFN